MLGIGAFLFIVTSFDFLESRAIFTDLSFSTVFTAGPKKLSSVIAVAALSKYLCFINPFCSGATWS